MREGGRGRGEESCWEEARWVDPHFYALPSLPHLHAPPTQDTGRGQCRRKLAYGALGGVGCKLRAGNGAGEGAGREEAGGAVITHTVFYI